MAKTPPPWRPGQKRPLANSKPFHRHVVASGILADHHLTVYQCPEEHTHSLTMIQPLWAVENGEAVLLSIRFGPNNKGAIMNLTAMSESELEALATLFNEALERARPIVQERDKTAREAEANGDFSYARSSRGVPSILVLPRQIRKD